MNVNKSVNENIQTLIRNGKSFFLLSLQRVDKKSESHEKLFVQTIQGKSKMRKKKKLFEVKSSYNMYTMYVHCISRTSNCNCCIICMIVFICK